MITEPFISEKTNEKRKTRHREGMGSIQNWSFSQCFHLGWTRKYILDQRGVKLDLNTCIQIWKTTKTFIFTKVWYRGWTSSSGRIALNSQGWRLEFWSPDPYKCQVGVAHACIPRTWEQKTGNPRSRTANPASQSAKSLVHWETLLINLGHQSRKTPMLILDAYTHVNMHAYDAYIHICMHIHMHTHIQKIWFKKSQS